MVFPLLRKELNRACKTLGIRAFQRSRHRGVGAVSYTHLDVYKRQLLDCYGKRVISGQYINEYEYFSAPQFRVDENDPNSPMTCLLYTSRCV